MIKDKTRPVSLRMDELMYNTIVRESRYEDRTISNMIHKLLEMGLTQHQHEKRLEKHVE
jgi:hypothetical protein